MGTKKKILILGGLGFIGKNLAKGLVRDGHEITILAPGRGEDDGFVGNEFKGELLIGNILDVPLLEEIVKDKDVIFSLAGSSGAADSIKNPYVDLNSNLRGHLNILESCRKHNPEALLIFPSSRLVYGKPLANPVGEDHPLHPESIYAIHKLTTEHYYLLYQRLYGIRSIIFRISNPYGPYQKFGSNHYGILNWFVHKAISNEEIVIFGDGSQKRDFLHVNDVVELCKTIMDTPAAVGRIFNIGFGEGISIREAVDVIKRHVPGAIVSFKPWPEIDQKIETGDYISDLSQITKFTGWRPKIGLDAGLKDTIDFYAAH